jgi:CBS domain containing-hemolysin-like protein
MSVAWLIGALFFLLASGFYSGSEMGLYCVNRLRLRLRTGKEEHPEAAGLVELVSRQQETVLGILLGTNLANYLLTVCTTTVLLQLAGFHPARAEIYTAVILSPVIFVFGDVVPKNWYQVEADRLMYRSARLLRGSVLLFRHTGILWLLHGMTRLGARLAGHDESLEWREPRGEVVGLLREGAAEGALSEQQAQIVERVMNLSDVRVGSIMIPRRHVVTVSSQDSRTDFQRAVRGHNYSRMPVLSPDRRTVLGIVNIFDVLADPDEGTIEKWMHPPLTIQASETASNALVRMQRTKEAMAVVTDPRRGFVGVITLKDVVEEIFGELYAW